MWGKDKQSGKIEIKRSLFGWGIGISTQKNRTSCGIKTRKLINNKAVILITN